MRKTLLVLLVLISFCSCRGILTRILLTRKYVTLSHYKNGDRDFVFINAAHLGKPAYYQDIKFIVDSLRASGYTILYEGLAIDHRKYDSLTIREYKLKVRKVTGVYISDFSDIDENKSLDVPAIKGLVRQTLQNTGIDPKRDIRADYELVDLVKEYEKRKGEIRLSDCDWNSDPNARYKCGKINPVESDYLLIHMRNQRVVHLMDSLRAPKAAVLYGMIHSYGVTDLMRAKDSAWVFQYHPRRTKPRS